MPILGVYQVVIPAQRKLLPRTLEDIAAEYDDGIEQQRNTA
jgi:hypothetical protein